MDRVEMVALGCAVMSVVMSIGALVVAVSSGISAKRSADAAERSAEAAEKSAKASVESAAEARRANDADDEARQEEIEKERRVRLAVVAGAIRLVQKQSERWSQSSPDSGISPRSAFLTVNEDCEKLLANAPDDLAISIRRAMFSLNHEDMPAVSGATHARVADVIADCEAMLQNLENLAEEERG